MRLKCRDFLCYCFSAARICATFQGRCPMFSTTYSLADFIQESGLFHHVQRCECAPVIIITTPLARSLSYNFSRIDNAVESSQARCAILRIAIFGASPIYGKYAFKFVRRAKHKNAKYSKNHYAFRTSLPQENILKDQFRAFCPQA